MNISMKSFRAATCFIAIGIFGIAAILLSLAGDTHAYSCKLNLPPPNQVTMMVDAYEYYACSELPNLTPPGYLNATLSNVDPGYSVANGGYGAYCADLEGYVLDNPLFGNVTYQVQFLSSIDNPSFEGRPWNKINYILKNYPTPPNSWLDIQAAIWTLIYDCNPSDPLLQLFDCPEGNRTAPCYFPFGGTICTDSGCPQNQPPIVNITNVQNIVVNANAYGGNFIPGNGDFFAIIIDPLSCTGASGSYISYCDAPDHLPFQLLFTTTTCDASYTITASAGANGSIDPIGAVSADHGSSNIFTVTPDANYHAEMSGTCGGNLVGDTYTTNPIIADCTVIANFAINAHTLTYYAGTNGSISGPTPQSVNHGASGTAVTALANMGYHFVQWSDSSTVNPRTDTNVTGNITVTATFAITVTPVRISPNLRYHSGIQVAYDDCSDGDTIQCQAVALSGEVLFNTLNKSVTLKGGYNSDFTSNTGYTTINGRMIISNGTVTVENIIIK